MALIGDIRKRTGLLVGFVALALLLFILSEAVSSLLRGGGGASSVGSINGKTIDIQEFQKAVSNSSQNSQASGFQVVDNVWNQFINNKLLTDEVEALGISVSSAEVDELMTSEDQRFISPFVRQIFGDQQTGQFDVARVREYIQQVESQGDATQKQQLKDIRAEVALQQKVAKYNNMIRKGIYTPTWMADREYKSSSAMMELAFAFVPYANINDNDVKVEDTDLKAYIKANEKDFEKEPTVALEFVVFDVVATQADKDALNTKMLDIAAKFKATASDSAFVVQNTGKPEAWGKNYFTRDQVASSPIADSLFSAAVGTVFGPYDDAGQMTVTKLLGRQAIPDSVRARHILLPIQGADRQAVYNKLDSVKNAIKAGKTTFAQAADSMGTDGTKGKGGDLGFYGPGAMVPEFNDLTFYKAKVGELNIVQTQFGLHLVEVTGQKTSGKVGVWFASIGKEVLPSKQSRELVNQKALNFIVNNRDIETFRKGAQKEGLVVKKAGNLKPNDYSISELGPQDASRDIIKWAHEAKAGEVSKKPYSFENQQSASRFTNRYVVVAVASKKGKGLPSVDDVREQILPMVRNEKKGAMIKEKIGTQTDVTVVASKFNVEVDTAVGVSMNSRFTPVIGQETKLLGAASVAAIGANSKTIVGKNGVYVFKVLNRTEAPVTDPLTVRKQVSSKMEQSVNSKLMPALRDKAKIKDNRSKFY